MVTYESDNRAAPEDGRRVAANGHLYFAKTSTLCTTCGHPDRNMYVSRKVEPDCTLECPVCGLTMHTRLDAIKVV